MVHPVSGQCVEMLVEPEELIEAGQAAAQRFIDCGCAESPVEVGDRPRYSRDRDGPEPRDLVGAELPPMNNDVWMG
jgi:hypothetical protein